MGVSLQAMIDKQRCILILHAHPDDESSKGAATMARYSDKGCRVVLVCATGGEEGDVINPRMDRPGIKERMTEIRKAELETACDILGVARVYMLGYRDSGMPDSDANNRPEAFCNADPVEATARIVEIIRAERPEIVIGYDDSPGYPHPDHLRVNELGDLAFHQAGDPDEHPGAGSPWRPSKLYHFASFTMRRISALHEAALAEGMVSPFAERMEEWTKSGFTEPNITTQIDVHDYIELRNKALLAHATQIDPEGFWFAIPDELQKKVYPWEDYTLVDPLPNPNSTEDDLFAGL
jgi:mycothiol S-conjugate amidase